MNTTQIITTTTSQIISELQQLPNNWALTSVDGNKRPYRTNWQLEKPLSKRQIASEIKSGRAKGYGIRTGEVSGGILAVDVDGYAAQALLQKLCDGDLPDTVIFTSGKPGRRQLLYFITEEYWQVVKTIKLKTGVKDSDGKEQLLEFRWNGCQSVLPPSVHPETGNYFWVRSPQDIEVAQCPNWVIELMLCEEQTPETRPTLLDNISVPIAETIPLESCLAKQTCYLLETGGISKGGRNDTAAMLARDLLGTANYLDSIGQRYDGDPWDIFYNWCIIVGLDKDSPKGQPETVWKSAQKSNPSPSCGVDGVNNCIRGWYLRTNKPSGRSYGSKFSGNGNEPPINEVSLRDRVLEIIDRGLSSSERLAAFIQLAKFQKISLREVQGLAELLEQEFDLEETKSDRIEEINFLLQTRNKRLTLSDYLHPTLANPLEKVAGWMCVDPESLLTVLMPTAASLLHPSTRVIVKECIDFREPLIFYSGVVSESGNRKSPTFKVITKPLRKFQSEADARFAAEKQQYEEDLEAWKQNGKDGEKPQSPAPVREYYLDNVTGEALDRIKAQQPDHGLLLRKDELSGLFGSYNSYRGGKGSDKEGILSGWNGDGVKVNRAGGLRISLSQDATSIVGAIQPGKLRKLMGDLQDEQGEWGRFLWYYAPLRKAHLPENDTRFDVGDLLMTIYTRLDKLPAVEYRFSPEAQKLYQRWHSELEERKFGESRQGLRSAIAKMQGYTARIAGILHILWEVAQGLTPVETIPAERMKAAITLADFYLGQVTLIQAEGEAAQGTNGLSPILSKLLETAIAKGGLSTRDAVRGVLQRRANTSKALEYFKELEAMGYGFLEKKVFYPLIENITATNENVISVINLSSSLSSNNQTPDVLINQPFQGVNENLSSLSSLSSTFQKTDDTPNGFITISNDNDDDPPPRHQDLSSTKFYDDNDDNDDKNAQYVGTALFEVDDKFDDKTDLVDDKIDDTSVFHVGDRMSQSVDASVDVPQIEVGDRVTHSDPYHKRGKSSGVVEAINETGDFVVSWIEDGENQLSKVQRTYGADELRLLNHKGDRIIVQVRSPEQTTITFETITNLSLRSARKLAGELGIAQKVAGKDLSKQDLIEAIVECWQSNSAAVVDASILQGIGALGEG